MDYALDAPLRGSTPDTNKTPVFALDKVDILHYLADAYALRRFLEIATPFTGHRFGSLDRKRFDACERILYRCPPEFADGHPIAYRSTDDDIAEAAAALAQKKPAFDLIFVDPFHTYENSRRDMETAFSLLAPGGFIVVHDCLPENQAMATPVVTPDAWCGETYIAYLDFVLDNATLRYCTVNTDYGCGVIRKAERSRAFSPFRRYEERRRTGRWRKALHDRDETWRRFQIEKRSLLRLKSPDQFRRAVSAGQL